MPEFASNSFIDVPVVRGRTVSVNLTKDQEDQYNQLKTDLGFSKDSDLLKFALATVVDGIDNGTIVPKPSDDSSTSGSEAESGDTTDASSASAADGSQTTPDAGVIAPTDTTPASSVYDPTTDSQPIPDVPLDSAPVSGN